MPGVRIGRLSAGQRVPNVRPFLVGNSRVINPEDVLIETTVDGSTTTVRPMSAGDISGNYKDGGSTVLGILGMALYDASTDSGGYAANPINPTGIAGGARPIYPLPTYASGIDTEPVTGRSRMNVALFDEHNEFSAIAAGASNGNVTVTPALIGTLAGFQLVSGVYKLDTSKTTVGSGAAVTITGVDEGDPNYNVASKLCRVFFRILPSLNQYALGTPYAS